MAKLKAVNPLTNREMDLSIRGIAGLLLGGLVIWGVAATTQNIGKKATAAANSKYVDFVPDAIAAQEVTKIDTTVFYG